MSSSGALSLGPASSVRWHMVGLMMAYSFMSWFNRVSMSVAGTERLIPHHGISPTAMGFVYSALLFAYALCMTPGGWLIDRKGARVALMLMGFGSAAFVALTGVVGLVFFSGALLWGALLVVRALVGVFTAPIYPACAWVVGRWLPLPQRAGANGLVNGAALFGIASTFFVFGSLIDWFGWPAAFVLTGLATAALALFWSLYARDDPARHPGVNAAELQWIGPTGEIVPHEPTHPHEQEGSRGDFHLPTREISPHEPTHQRSSRREWLEVPPNRSLVLPSHGEWLKLLKNRSLVLLTLSYAAIGYFEYLFFFWTEYYFHEVLHLETNRSRLYATVLNLAMALGMFTGGWLSDRLLAPWGHRWGRAAVPIGGMLLSAALLGAGILVREPWAVVVCFSLALAAGGACEGPCWATALELGGRRGGTAAGIFNTGGNAGGLLAPIVTPWVSEHWGWPWGIALGGLACLLGVGLWLGIDPHERVGEVERKGR
jgi:MFS family permease